MMYIHTSTNENILVVDCDSVDDGVVTAQVLDEVTVRKLPLFDVIRGAGRERVPATYQRVKPINAPRFLTEKKAQRI